MLQLERKVVKSMKLNKECYPYFEKAGQIQNYQKTDLIYMQEDDADLIYLIIKGKVRVYVMNSNGKEVTIDILKSGEIFGESALIPHSKRPTTVEALQDVQLIACYPEKLYLYCQQSQELMIFIMQSMSKTCDYLTAMMKRSYTYNRYEKVAAFLLDQIQYDQQQEISYTHEEMASLLGLSRVTVTKVLNEFEKEKMILLQYKTIVIKDKNKLYSLLHK